MKKISYKRLTRYQILNLLAGLFSFLIFVGAVAMGAMLILAETLFYEIEAFSLLPLWYKLVMLAGLVGCLFTKNRLDNHTVLSLRSYLSTGMLHWRLGSYLVVGCSTR